MYNFIITLQGAAYAFLMSHNVTYSYASLYLCPLHYLDLSRIMSEVFWYTRKVTKCSNRNKCILLDFNTQNTWKMHILRMRKMSLVEVEPDIKPRSTPV
jgi:hypothetical protein